MTGIRHRSFSHLTPRYIKSRLAVMLDERLHPTHPWLTKDAVAFLDQVIRSSDVGVEFGSGRSTLWLAGRLAHLTSVENNRDWYGIVSGQIGQLGLAQKVDYRLSLDDGTYAAQADTLADDSIDFCLIDGAARDQCALNMLPKLRRNALLVIDNINRHLPNDATFSPNSRRSQDGCENAAWGDFATRVGQWRRYWTSNGVSDTAIWIKP